ncbi:MAG: hypothetical protein IJ877_04030 [Candidatus Gastranaerophilales bacterium]|nr:hypothetical protein [bacterium]MBR2068911.1 hypothetical protein [Candidatus Gastranaerophilales bacterium]
MLSLPAICALSVHAQNFNSLNETSKKFVLDTIEFQKKLKTCTPYTFSGGGTSYKIIGVKNDVCNFYQTAPEVL